ncbi:MAG TPA: hypothetical protein DDZ80_02240 [Cyanobacteria bacterium UBA8803]|nr:hypothetical protein [Cyanobacteria bacterium UBA9273]HBL57404.1 hypothetical protein [Cyanobacteria bacterium UBA8803]
MGKLVVLELDGNFKEQGVRVTLEVGEESAPHQIKLKGGLPANPDLDTHIQNHWENYRSVEKVYRIKPKKITHTGSLQQQIKKCQESAHQLRESLNSWLNSEEFRPLDRRLRAELSRDEDIRVLIRTEDSQLQKLPWQEWEFFKNYPKAEPALSPLESEPAPKLTATSLNSQARILVILGHDDGINVEADRQLLQSLPNADLVFLVKPQKKEVVAQLWEQPWDIIFFAGHSETEGDIGRIYINSEDSLSIDELWYGLRKAVDRGLKLAIFNSCDGLGLSRQLDDLNIPQMIIMRELIPDRVAQEFLKHFLPEFARGQSLYGAVREARQRLHSELEDDFPCASWLPVICQNPAEVPLNWEDLFAKPQLEIEVPLPVSPPTSSGLRWRNLKPVLLASVVVTSLVMGVRSLGLLQPWELQAYDALMRSRQPELLDPRILVVEVTQEDTDRYLYPLKDTKIVELIRQLEEYNPLAIGLAIHRYQPRPELNDSQSRDRLIKLFNRNKNLFTICNYGSSAQDHAPPPEFSKEQLMYQVGFSDVPNDLTDSNNSTVRRQLLSYDPKLASFSSPCTTPYSLSFHLAYRFLDAKGIKPLRTINNKEWQFDKAVFKGLATRTGGYQNLEGGRSEILLNYRPADKSGQIAKKVSLTQVLEAQVDPTLIEGLIVLIGYSAPIAKDYINTPYGEMAGVWIHAHMVSQLLSAAMGERSLLWVLPQWGDFQWGDALFIWFWSLIGGVLAGRIRSILYLILASGVTTLILYQICLIMFNQGGWMPLVPSGFSLLVTSSGLVIYTISQSRQKPQLTELT